MRARAALALSLLVISIASRLQAQEGLDLVEAVRRTLELQPSVRFQEQELEGAHGDLRAARGQFDSLVQSSFGRFREDLPNTAGEALLTGAASTVSNLTSYGFGFRKQLRSGLLIAPSVDFSRASRNLSDITANRANVSVALTQPLLRGQGREVVAANERVSEIGVGAAGLDLRQVRSQSALQTVLAYWSYLFAVERLSVFVESESRSQELEEQIRALIAADRRPAADLKQVEANRRDRTALRIGGEQGLFQARHQLGLAMGIPYEEIADLPLPSRGFPDLAAIEPPSEERLIREALARRFDLRATREREVQSRVLLGASEDAVRPRLDLVLTSGYRGLDEGTSFRRFFSPFESNVSGLSASLDVLYEWTAANNFAYGRLLRSQSLLEQSLIQRRELERTIRSGVVVARNDLARSIEQVENSRAAADLYRSAIEDERIKQQLGTSTILDLLTTEDRLTRSLLDELGATLGYASAVARLRFETGTLLKDGTPDQAVAIEMLTTVPFVDEAR